MRTKEIMKDETLIAKWGDFDSLRVAVENDVLTFESYWEGKAEGYSFEFKLENDMWILTREETSHPVPGSLIIAEDHSGGELAIDWPVPGEITIPNDAAFWSAIWGLIEDELAYLELNQEDDNDN